jgi:hypothetical protein
MSTATFPSRRGHAMGLLVDRQFKACGVCGGKIQVDHSQSPGDTEDGPAKVTLVEMHIGSCTPPPSEEVIPDNSNVPAAPPVEHKAEAKVEHHAASRAHR